MIVEYDISPVPDTDSFEAVLDRTCERLWEKKVQYSIKRIQELEVKLHDMEDELDKFLSSPR
jgi:hypothetical protein